jgi:ankyrin repeat protein
MLLAARYGHKSIVETFLNVGENIDIQILCDSRYTALHCTNTQFLTAIDACHHGYPDIVKLLIDKRASIGLVSGYGLRPIHTAANNGHAACVGLLLQAGEDIDVTHLSDWKYTPLHWA